MLVEPQDESTVLKYDADVEIGYKLMSVDARLIQSAAGNILQAFFSAFQAHVERLAAPASDMDVAGSVPDETDCGKAGGGCRARSRLDAGRCARGCWPDVVARRSPGGLCGVHRGFLAGHAG